MRHPRHRKLHEVLAVDQLAARAADRAGLGTSRVEVGAQEDREVVLARACVSVEHPPDLQRRWWRWQASTALQPRADRGVEGVRIDTGQHPTHRGLVRRPDHPGQRIRTDPQAQQHLRRGVGCPFTDRRQRLRSGQYRAHRHREHTGQVVAQPAAIAWIRQRREMTQQTPAPLR